MKSNHELNEQERRYLRALKLFFERSEDPKHFETSNLIDQLSPDQQRAIIKRYHMLLEDPEAFLLSYKIMETLSPVFRAWNAVGRLFWRKD